MPSGSPETASEATRLGAYLSIAGAMTVWAIFFAMSGFGGEYTVWGGVMPVALCFPAATTTTRLFAKSTGGTAPRPAAAQSD